jgi:hypothetical protein
MRADEECTFVFVFRGAKRVNYGRSNTLPARPQPTLNSPKFAPSAPTRRLWSPRAALSPPPGFPGYKSLSGAGRGGATAVRPPLHPGGRNQPAPVRRPAAHRRTGGRISQTSPAPVGDFFCSRTLPAHPQCSTPSTNQGVENHSQSSFHRFSLALSDRVPTMVPEGSPHWK